MDHHQKLNREVAPEEMKDLDRVSEYLHIHPGMPAISHDLLNLLPEVQQTQTPATQGADEDSATVGYTKSREPPFKVPTRTRRPE